MIQPWSERDGRYKLGQKEEIRSKQPTLNSISDIELKQLPSIYPSVQHPAAGSLFVKNASMSFRASVVGFDEAILQKFAIE